MLEKAMVEEINARWDCHDTLLAILDLWMENEMDRPWHGLKVIAFWKLKPERQIGPNGKECFCWLEEGCRKDLNEVCGAAGLLRSIYKKLGMPAGQVVARYPSRYAAYFALAMAINESCMLASRASEEYYAQRSK